MVLPRVIPEHGNFAMLPHDRVITDLTDQEAFDLARTRGSQTVGGRDPVHLTLERVWFTQIAYFLGLQRVEAGEIEHVLDPNWSLMEAPFVANHIYRIVMGQVARMSSSKPQTDVLPKSTDIEDDIGAKVGDFFLKHYEDTLNFRAKKRTMGFWLCTTGNAFLCVDWNPRMGPRSKVYKNPYDSSLLHPSQVAPEDQAWLDKIKAFEENVEGKVEVDVLSGFQVFVPPGYTTLDEMPWIIVEHDRSIDWMWDNCPDQAKHVRPDELDVTPEAQYKRRLASLVGRHGFSMPGRADDYSEMIRVRTLWFRPSGRMPKGRKIVITKNLVLENVDHPFSDKFDLRSKDRDMAFPIVHFKYCEAPGRFWAMGLVEHLLGPQREYNKTRYQTMQMRDVLAHPQWIAPKTAELTSTRNDYGDILEYALGGGKPELVNPPTLSAIHEQTQQAAIYDMQTISAQSEVSQAQVPAGVRSGVAIEALQSKDMGVVSIVIEDQEDGWKLVSEKLLRITDKCVSTPQMMHIYGEFRGADVVIHKGSDINGNTRVRVVPGSMMPKSKMEQKQHVMDMVQLGALNPAMNPRDRRVVFKTMEIGDADKYFQEEDLDRRRANIENQTFLRPQVDKTTGLESPYPDVNEDDDHQAHLEQHLIFKKSDAFERLPPMRKLALEAHMAKHKEAISQLMQTQALMAGMQGGSGGSPPREPGKPSAPAKAASPAGPGG